MDSGALLKWYAVYKRDLPWRLNKNPYNIWISEIILQQTRVSQGLQYYYRFIEAFPYVETLAEAPLDLVLKYWQGLGYYSRARNLHEAARQIAYIYKGVFPQKYNELLKLKGIGKYTAGAIASIAYSERVPVVDGNVYRVISRLYGITTSIDQHNAYVFFSEKVLEMMNNHEPGEFNQALMELGALVCLAQKPDCVNCPLQKDCFAFKNSMQYEFPVRNKKAKITHRFFHYLVLQNQSEILLHKRSQNDIWKGLHDFPLIESCSSLSIEELQKQKSFKDYLKGNITIIGISEIQKTKLSHQTLAIQYFHFKIENKFHVPIDCFWANKNELVHYAVPACISKYIENEF